ncbi:MAG TPA: hypothetical protein VLG47_03015 [Candidatus Saccharimonadales bacterium]|nr:hypothetical protein [Candidatus Saccharimonadales bacterium]
MSELERYPARHVLVVDFETAEQAEIFNARIAAAAEEAGVSVMRQVLDHESIAVEIALQQKLGQSIMFSEEYSAPFTRAAKALTRQNVSTFGDIFALGEKGLAQVHGIAKPSVEVIKTYLAENFPELEFLNEPTAEDIARYFNSLGLVDARALRGMPPHSHLPARVTVDDLISHRSREAFKPVLSAPDALFEDDAEWRTRYYSAVRTAQLFASDFLRARTAGVEER